MGILDKFKKNPIEKLDLKELREEEIKIKTKIERIRKDINKLEKDKKSKFQDGIGADSIKKKMLALELKQIDMESKFKMKNFQALHKQYMLLNNFIVMKKYEKDLMKSKLWEKLSKVSSDDLESKLINVNFMGADFEEVIGNLNDIFSDIIETDSANTNEDIEDIYQVWAEVESGTLDVDTATEEYFKASDKDSENEL